MTRLLEVEDLRTRIRLRSGTVHAVDGLSLDVEAGETVGIVGESGCGKTMAAMSIMRLLPRGAFIAGGAIRFDGRDLVGLSDEEIRGVRGNEIGMVFQDPMTSLNPTMTIGRQVAEAVTIHRDVSKAQALERAVEVLDLVGLPRPAERVHDYPHQLSGGLRQRVMIAMALACGPKLLIADEPTTALDVTIQAQILRLLDEIKRELGMGIILITHDMGVIAGRTDRVVVMYAGRKVETASTGELFANVRHPYTEALLASIPKLDQDKSQDLYSIPGLPPDLRFPPRACRFAPRCAFATERCRTEDPPLGGEDPDHPYACFHPRQSSAVDDAGLGASLIAVAEKNAALRDAYGKELELLVSSDAVDAGNGNGAGSNGRSSEAILEFEDVFKEFSVTAGAILRRRIGTLHAVSGVELAVRRGETFGLVGESGCGKTTLGRLGVALDSPTRGRVLFNGVDLAAVKGGALRALRQDLQFMFQDPYASLDPRMRVKEIISEPLDIARRGSAADRVQTVRRLLDEVGLAHDAMDRYPHEFSGGQRQRLGLARALALNPSVIVADEPVSALDVSIQSQILNLDEASPGASRAHLHRDLPRPLGRPLPGRPDRGHVPRQARRGRPRQRHLRPARPSIHGRPAGGNPRAQPRDSRRAGRQGGRPRRAPLTAGATLGLPIPHPLPARTGPVRSRDPSAAGVRSRALRRVSLPPSTSRAGRTPQRASPPRARSVTSGERPASLPAGRSPSTAVRLVASAGPPGTAVASQDRELTYTGFEVEQRALARQAAAVPGQRPVGADHAVARDDDRDRRRTDRRSDRTRLRVELARQCPIRRGRPVLDGPQRIPHAVLERRARVVERQLKARALAPEVLLELLDGGGERLGVVIRSRERGRRAREVQATDDSIRTGDEGQLTQRAFEDRERHGGIQPPQVASWKITPSATRCPAVTVLTPWRSATR